MKIVMSSGHGSKISGAVDIIHEHDEAVRVVNRTAEYMRQAGIDVITYEDTVSTSQDENLDRIVSFHNAQGPHDFDISVHFNSSNGTTSNPIGTEVFSYDDDELAASVSEAIADAGDLKDRGAKDGSGLYFCRNTAENALLLEICFVNSRADCELYEWNFDLICCAIAEAIAGEKIQPGPTPPKPPGPRPPDVRPMLEQGDKGDDVAELQKSLGVLIPDGDFGSITETWVRAFQAACGLGADGMVGDQTWAAVDNLDARMHKGKPRLPKALADRIYTMVQESEIADYSWPDRGYPPEGYIAGMALSFAYAVTQWQADDEAAGVMAHAEGNPDKDALAWYKDEFSQLGMKNNVSGLDTLRHLFVMEIGLGMRESSGIYVEGRDLTADNVESTTAEASLFQTSWNISSASSAIPPLLDDFWQNPNGFLSAFKEGISPTSNNLSCYGSGDGARYQFLSRFCPLFHVMVSAVGMRTLRQHWGPINRREVTIKKEADDLLKSVQELVESVA